MAMSREVSRLLTERALALTLRSATLALATAGVSSWALTTPASAQTAPSAADTARPDSASAPRSQVLRATRDYRETGAARTLIDGDVATFPYGHAQPVLTCAILRACVIELEAGETVLSKITGDAERWEIVPAPAGPDGRTTLVVVKPHDCDLTTNLVLATDRRLYDLTLDAQPCKPAGGKGKATNPQEPYVRHVRFYYPDQTVAEWSRPAPVRITPEVLALNFRYRVKRDKQFPWVPAQVFDDGAHVYIKVPDAARHAEAPVLFVLEADGSKTLLNYTVTGGDTYVTDRLFDRGVLIAGVDGKERRVTIERERGAGPAAAPVPVP